MDSVLSASVKLPGQFDLILDLLPAAAREKLRHLRQVRDDARAAARSLSDNIRDLIADKNAAEVSRRRLTDGYQGSGFQLPVDDPRVREKSEKIKYLNEEISRLKLPAEQRSEAAQLRGRLVDHVERWLKQLPPTTKIALHLGRQVTLPKGETALDAVERVRRRVRELQADILQVRAAPRPSSVCKKLIREQIEQMAATGRPNVAPVIDNGEPLQFPIALVRFPISSTVENMVDVLAIMTWLQKDALVAKLDLEIDELADEKNALTDAQRAEREATLLRDMLANEREEESYIMLAAQHGGVDMPRRDDCDPRAVLELAGDLPPFKDW